MCSRWVYGSCDNEVLWLAVLFVGLIVALLATLIWFHDHNNHKPWKLKCGWVKVDGMWHFFSRKVTPEEPCLFGGSGCSGVKCAKGMIQSEQKIDFVKHWNNKPLDKPRKVSYNNHK